ncbi:MAG: hypothetical protein IPK75_20420 [Acidobacteria bacterium]|nr:hypothetical protein [Acidobacteriota bacterium]
MKINRRTANALVRKLERLRARLSKEKHPRPLWNVKGEWPALRTIADPAKRRRVKAAKAKEAKLVKWQTDLRNLLPLIEEYLQAKDARQFQVFVSLRTVHAAKHHNMNSQDLLSHGAAMADLATAIKTIKTTSEVTK